VSTISAPFAQVLAAGRRQFNARVEEAKRRAPGFDAAGFANFLQQQVDGVVLAVHAAAPARVTAVALAAYDIALGLCLHGLAGPAARVPLLNQAWSQLFPRLAARIAEQPQDVLGALSNAVVHLGGVDGARVDEWLASMAQLAPEAATVVQLLDLGKVLAWRAGLAQFRAGALQAADALPPVLQLAAMGAPADGSWGALRAALAADPWASVQPRRVDGWQVGTFTGFGGRFAQPPELRVAPAGFLVRSGTRHFLAVADAFGAVLLPANADEFAAATLQRPAHTPRLLDRRLVFADRELALDLPAEGLTIVADAHTVAIASPYSHAVRLLPL
jgi:hypothetical protein